MVEHSPKILAARKRPPLPHHMLVVPFKSGNLKGPISLHAHAINDGNLFSRGRGERGGGDEENWSHFSANGQ